MLRYRPDIIPYKWAPFCFPVHENRIAASGHNVLIETRYMREAIKEQQSGSNV